MAQVTAYAPPGGAAYSTLAPGPSFGPVPQLAPVRPCNIWASGTARVITWIVLFLIIIALVALTIWSVLASLQALTRCFWY